MASTRAKMTIEWSVPIGQARPLTTALHSLAADVRPTLGCVSCSVLTDFANRNVVRYVEEWQTEEDLRRRLQSDMFSVLAALIEGSLEHPKVEFVLPGGIRGLDFAEEVRGLR